MGGQQARRARPTPAPPAGAARVSGQLYLPGLAVLVVVLVVLCLAVRPETRLSVAATLAVPQVFVPGLPLPAGPAVAAGRRRGRRPHDDRRAAARRHAPGRPARPARRGRPRQRAVVPRPRGGAVHRPAAGPVRGRPPPRGQRGPGRARRARPAARRGPPPGCCCSPCSSSCSASTPPSEAWFLRSSAADWLVGPAADALFSGMRNNVLDPAKAGGLFVNGNAASLLGGLSLLGFLVAHRLGHGRRHLLGAAVCLAGVVMTGSKTGLVLVVALPLLRRGHGAPVARPGPPHGAALAAAPPARHPAGPGRPGPGRARLPRRVAGQRLDPSPAVGGGPGAVPGRAAPGARLRRLGPGDRRGTWAATTTRRTTSSSWRGPTPAWAPPCSPSPSWARCSWAAPRPSLAADDPRAPLDRARWSPAPGCG